jgi:hypothetical protein
LAINPGIIPVPLQQGKTGLTLPNSEADEMAKKGDGDDFPQKVKQQLALRACYICSNPDCLAMTVAASETEIEKYVYVGKAAHITAARPGGVRYEMSPRMHRKFRRRYARRRRCF